MTSVNCIGSLKKILAVGLSLLILASPFSKGLASSPVDNKDHQRGVDIRNIIPPSLAWATPPSIKNRSQAPIILVQDLHLNPQAQLKTSRLLEHLHSQKLLGAVGVEGAFDIFNFTFMRQFKNPQRSRWAMEQLIREKKIAAPSVFGITTSKMPPLVLGIDDRVHYRRHALALRFGSRQANRLKKNISEILFSIDSEKKATFPIALYEADQRRLQHMEGTLSPDAYLRSLIKDLALFDNSNYELENQIKIFLEGSAYQSFLDEHDVKKEITSLINQLSAELPKKEFDALLSRIKTNSENDGIPSHAYTRLLEYSRKHRLPKESISLIERLERTAILRERFNPEQFRQEIGALEHRFWNQIQVSDEGKDLINQSTILVLIKKMLSFSLTSLEWNELKTVLLHDDNAHTPHPTWTWLTPMFLSELSSAVSFYQEADRRSLIMARRLVALKKANAHQDPQKLVLGVIGGFHTQLMVREFQKNNIDAIIVTPNLNVAGLRERDSALSEMTDSAWSLNRIMDAPYDTLNPTFVNWTHTACQQEAITAAFDEGANPHPQLTQKKSGLLLKKQDGTMTELRSPSFRNAPSVNLNSNKNAEPKRLKGPRRLFSSGPTGLSPKRRFLKNIRLEYPFFLFCIGAIFMMITNANCAELMSTILIGAGLFGMVRDSETELLSFVPTDISADARREIVDRAQQPIDISQFEIMNSENLLVVAGGARINLGSSLSGLIAVDKPGTELAHGIQTRTLYDGSNPSNRLMLVITEQTVYCYDPTMGVWSQGFPVKGPKKSVGVGDLYKSAVFLGFIDRTIKNHFGQRRVQNTLIAELKQTDAFTPYNGMVALKHIMPIINGESWGQLPLGFSTENSGMGARWAVLVDKTDINRRMFFVITPTTIYLYDNARELTRYSRKQLQTHKERDIFIDTILQEIRNHHLPWEPILIPGVDEPSTRGNFSIGGNKGAQIVLYRQHRLLVEAAGQAVTFGWASLARIRQHSDTEPISEIYRIAPNQFVFDGIGDIGIEDRPLIVYLGNHLYLPDYLTFLAQNNLIRNPNIRIIEESGKPVKQKMREAVDSKNRERKFIILKTSKPQTVYKDGKMVTQPLWFIVDEKKNDWKAMAEQWQKDYPQQGHMPSMTSTLQVLLTVFLTLGTLFSTRGESPSSTDNKPIIFLSDPKPANNEEVPARTRYLMPKIRGITSAA